MTKRDFTDKIIVPPKAMLKNIESILMESKTFLNRQNFKEEVSSMYRLCLHSWINYIDGEDSKRFTENGIAESDSGRNLALAGVNYQLLEKTSNTFTHYRDIFRDIPKGKCLLSEEMYLLELSKLRRSSKLREEDKLYIVSSLDSWGCCRKKK